tara:strand:- start:5760 stop:6239 length:480 start_codon:yes stop_codon:yes gene_type:complete
MYSATNIQTKPNLEYAASLFGGHMINQKKSAKNLYGTIEAASSWPNPKVGPPLASEKSYWYTVRRMFGSHRPTSTLTKEAWPNPPVGPPCLKKVKREEGDGFVNDVSHVPSLANALNWTITNSNRTELGVSMVTLEMYSLSSSGGTWEKNYDDDYIRRT